MERDNFVWKGSGVMIEPEFSEAWSVIINDLKDRCGNRLSVQG